MQPVAKSTDPNELGKEAFAKHDFKTAIKHFTDAIEADANNYLAYANRSACNLSLSKNFDAGATIELVTTAVEDANKAIKINPKYVRAYVRKGQALMALKKFAEAKKAFEAGLKIDPVDKQLHDGVAAAQKLATKSKKSKKAAEETLNPEDVVVGIDLGTTYSCVSYWSNGQVTIIPNERGDMTTPSYVSFSNGKRLVGQSAKLEATRNPENTVYDVKRFIGQTLTDSGVVEDLKRFAYTVVEREEGTGKPGIKVETEEGTEVFAPEEISAMVLGDLKKSAENYLGFPVTRAVITVPAYFNDAQRAATKAAGQVAGLDVLRIINEPTAAALAYGLDRKSINVDTEAQTVLIFDLGGGTFDVSVLTIDDGVFTVRGTGGDTHLGGEDFDNLVFQHIVQEVLPAQGFTSDVASIPRARKRLMLAIEKAKREVSSVDATEIIVEALVDKKDFRYTFTRAEFERITKGLFTRCLDTVKRVLKEADMEPSAINDIVLVGGSTRIPKIQSLLSEHFGGKQLCRSLNPDEAVAYGAAVQGAILSGKRDNATKDLLLLDVTPLSLGIETTGRVMSVIIPNNTQIPCTRTEIYTTEVDYQSQVDIAVYEGERYKTTDNHLLGEFTISDIEKAKRGEPHIEVTFAIDSDGILNVTAKDSKTGSENKIEINRGARTSAAEIAMMQANAQRYAEVDRNLKRTIELRNDLENKIYTLTEIAEETGDEKIQGAVNAAVDFLNRHPEPTKEQLAKQLTKLALILNKRKN